MAGRTVSRTAEARSAAPAIPFRADTASVNSFVRAAMSAVRDERRATRDSSKSVGMAGDRARFERAASAVAFYQLCK